MLEVVYTLEQGAIEPVYSSDGAIGLDLFACLPAYDLIWLDPGERKLISTGVSLSIPPTHYGRVAPRSGLALKAGLDVMAGVIDSDYRGVVGVILINLSNASFCVQHGDKIAQLIFERAERAQLHRATKLSATYRGAGGFGSTGY